MYKPKTVSEKNRLQKRLKTKIAYHKNKLAEFEKLEKALQEKL